MRGIHACGSEDDPRYEILWCLPQASHKRLILGDPPPPPQRKKSKGLRSCERGDQATPIHFAECKHPNNPLSFLDEYLNTLHIVHFEDC